MKAKVMNRRPNNAALYWGEGENSAGRSSAAFIRSRSDNFWRSVWKRIEGSNPQHIASHNVQKTPLRPPRDYVEEVENRRSA
jgi:hypothetical protein